tara:strand:+ start:1372 stop:1596 length:225 start_codon:yes stop_codon:yes gene_type:complete
MKQLSEIQAILVMLIIIGIYTLGVWHAAIHYYPIKLQVEVNDWQQRSTNCHWELLETHQENKKLRELLNLKGND